MRLDQLLVKKGLAASRTQAQKLIAAGKVKLSSASLAQVLDKPAMKMVGNEPLEVEKEALSRYVSRAGDKLKGAIDELGGIQYLSVDLPLLNALDIGQSTGGFSDCLLQEGIEKVVGIDVGHSQLAPKLKKDKRVQCLEKVNARTIDSDFFKQHSGISQFDLIVMDVSFISQTLVLPQLPPLLKEGGVLLSLVKPQFEVGPNGLSKGGIVKDLALFADVEATIYSVAQAQGLDVIQYFPSVITGGDGNHEFFLYAIKK